MLPSIALAPLLIFVIIDDLRNYRIRNDAVLALVALYALQVALTGEYDRALAHCLFAAALLAVILALYSLRMMGGGDAKLLAAALLWLGPENAINFCLTLLAVTVVYLIGMKLGWLPSRTKGDRTQIPFGPAIAIGWMLADAPRAAIVEIARSLRQSL